MSSTTNRPLAVFATLLVVVGIVGVAYISSLRSTPEVPATKTTTATSTVQTASGTVDQPLLFLVNDSSVSLVAADGTMEHLGFSDFALRAVNHRLPDEGSTAATGGVTHFSTVTTPTQSNAPSPVPSPQGTYAILPGGAQADDASVVDLVRGTEAPQKIVLRDQGIALKDADIVGWFSDTQFVVAATATSSRVLYVVGITGEPRYLTPLPDTIVFLAERDGFVWYATAIPGQGIEDEPTGPSEIHRVDSSGQDRLMTQSTQHVVENVVSDPTPQGDRIAYTTDDDQSYVFDQANGRQISLGKDRPLLFLSGNRIVLRDGYALDLMNMDTGQVQKLAALPEGDVSVFDAAPFLDATP